jgi:hypothetical protein
MGSTSDNKIAFQLNLLEPLLVNDLNNEVAIQAGILETLVALIKTQEIAKTTASGISAAGYQQPPLKAYIKFALRCLTSAIRTDAAVARVSNSLSSSDPHPIPIRL